MEQLVKESTQSVLESLIGKMVRINKGGPESKRGKLLAAHSDYLVLQVFNEQNHQGGNSNQNSDNNSDQPVDSQGNSNAYQIVYYNTHHVKSIIEDSTDLTALTIPSDEETVEYLEAENFSEIIEGLTNQYVQIDRGGPESRAGWLLAVKPDHLVLQTQEDGVVYYTLHHIRSISEGSYNSNQPQDIVNNTVLTYLDADNWDELMEGMKYYWVKINRGGPESIEGILADGDEDHLVLMVNKEVLRIPTFHIRNISLGAQSNQNNNSQNSNSNQSSDNNSSKKSAKSSKKNGKTNGKTNGKKNGNKNGKKRK